MKFFKVMLMICLSLFLSGMRVYAEDVYDVVLFWGQSNMVGSSGNIYAGVHDDRVDTLGKNDFSEYSQIDEEIINRYDLYNHVSVPISSGTVYEYKYLTNKLVELNSDTTIIGEKICVNNNNSISYYECDNNSEANTVLQQSNGTNIMPYFGKTYYEKTGHKAKTAPNKPTLSLSIKEYNEHNLNIGESKNATKYVVEKV